MNAFGTLQAETGRAVTFSHRRNCDPKPDDVRQHNDPELFRWIAEIQLRAKRRIGELSKALETLEGDNLKRVPSVGRATKREVLAAAGLSKTEAHRCGELLRQIEPGRGANQNIKDGAVPNVMTRTQAATDAGLSARSRLARNRCSCTYSTVAGRLLPATVAASNRRNEPAQDTRRRCG